MTETIISTLAGIISGILAGSISARVYINRYSTQMKNSQNAKDSHHLVQGGELYDNRGNLNGNRFDSHNVDNSQTARSDRGDATNIGRDQHNWRP